MIVSRIDGGLGNQMFQYAFGAYLADKHRCEHFLDTRSFAEGPQHGYLLDRFAISAKPADANVLQHLPAGYRDKGLRAGWIGRLLPSRLRRHKERPFGFSRKHLNLPNHSYLVGYWQSEQYFPGMRTRLLNEFSLVHPLSDQSARIADQIRETNSITLHIRRGDYLSNPTAASLYESLPLQYYADAVHNWARSNASAQVFVFSNDIKWCREQLRLPLPTSFVDHTSADTAFEDLAMMQLAACNVIANSTFSWWAAWLNQRASTIYAPPRWFRPDTMDDSAIIPRNWRQMVEPENKVAA